MFSKPKDKIHALINIKFVVCKCFYFPQVENLSCDKELVSRNLFSLTGFKKKKKKLLRMVKVEITDCTEHAVGSYDKKIIQESKR